MNFPFELPAVYQGLEIFAIIAFFISFYGLITSRKIFKSVVSLGIMEISVIMFILSIGFENGAIPPIGSNPEELTNAADPLAQALVITALIIGAAVTAVNLTVLITICRKHKTTDWDAVKKDSM